MNEIQRLAEPLQGKRVVHVSATAFGGGVAEINYTLVPLMADAGLDVEWRIIHGEDEFFNVTKAIHNGLQGAARPLTEEEQAIFARFNAENAARVLGVGLRLRDHPRPAAGGDDRLVSRPAREVDLARAHRLLDAERTGASTCCCRRSAATTRRSSTCASTCRTPTCPLAVVWPPAIDPLMPKNMALSPEDAAYIVDQFGIDVERPLLTQVSRFDPWKDPLGVIDAYREVKERFPEVQLALVGSMAHDDPEGWDYYKRTVEHADGDPDIYILSNMNNVGAVEVNAFQVHSHALIQKSTKEGFGLTVTEALWKARPMVAGRVGGIVAQIDDGDDGLARRLRRRVRGGVHRDPARPGRGAQRALKGKEHVRRHFLTPRLLRDWLVLFNKLVGNDTGGSRDHALSDPAGNADRRLEPRPVTYDNVDGRRVERRGGGGLVTALRGLREQHDVIWIASAMTDEDRVRRARGATSGGGRAASRTTPRRTTATTTSSRTRCLWFIQHSLWGLARGRSSTVRSTTPGTTATSASIEAFADAVVGDARRPPGRDRLLPRLPPLSRAARSCAPRGRTRGSRTSCTSRGRADWYGAARADAARGARRPARERRRRLPHEALGAELRAQLRGRRRRDAAATHGHATIRSRSTWTSSTSCGRATPCSRAEATLPTPREAHRPRRPHRSVEEHRARLSRVRAAARGASRVARARHDARAARSVAPGDPRVRRVPWPTSSARSARSTTGSDR